MSLIFLLAMSFDSLIELLEQKDIKFHNFECILLDNHYLWWPDFASGGKERKNALLLEISQLYYEKNKEHGSRGGVSRHSPEAIIT